LSPSADYDVAVLGGGPAGCAAALALLRLGNARVLVVESSRYDALRIGESLPPDVCLLLRQLGLWESFKAEAHEPCYGSCSSWGDDDVGYNDFLFNPHGHGWHLDRRRFDAWLARAAVEAGAELRTGARFEDCAPASDGGFRLRLDREQVRARCVVDATGTAARFARRQGARRLVHDRLVCVLGFFAVPSADFFSRLTLLEAVEQGWWYAAKLPDRKVAVAFASDPEIIQSAGLGSRDGWLARLRQTRHLAVELGIGSFLEGSLRTTVAPSFQLDTVAGDGWVAVGDAASAYDPISSQGVYKALADGLRAGSALATHLAGDATSLAQYRAALAGRFDGYLAQRNHFYGVERRWPEASFWRKRRSRSRAQQ
jgi:flavin-dependent dehydrogenase